MVDVDAFLEHHGVKGMKWGVRKKARQVKQVKKLEGQSKQYQDALDKVNAARPTTGMGQRSQIAQRNALQRGKERIDRDIELKKQGKLTSAQKQRIATGAIIVGLMVVAFAPVIKVDKLPKEASKSVSDVIKQTHAEQMSSLTRTFKEGHMNEAQYQKFSKSLNDRYARKIAEAAKGGL